MVHDPSHLIDLMPTCIELAGATYPQQYRGQAVWPLEGVSLLPALNGQPLDREQPICLEHQGNRAMRDGRWKLVAKGPAGAWELYDMVTDRTERNDLAAGHPERLQAMVRQWEAWARYHDCITLMDREVGEYLQQLQADGLADDTIVFFYGDHGMPMPRGKRLLHDSGMQVPLIVYFPEKWQHLAPVAAGETIDRLVSFVDFAPTAESVTGRRWGCTPRHPPGN